MTKRHSRIVGITFVLFRMFFLFFFLFLGMQIPLVWGAQLVVLLYLSFTSLNVHDPLACRSTRRTETEDRETKITREDKK